MKALIRILPLCLLEARTPRDRRALESAPLVVARRPTGRRLGWAGKGLTMGGHGIMITISTHTASRGRVREPMRQAVRMTSRTQSRRASAGWRETVRARAISTLVLCSGARTGCGLRLPRRASRRSRTRSRRRGRRRRLPPRRATPRPTPRGDGRQRRRPGRPAEGRLRVALKDFKLSPDAFVGKAGAITFQLVNEGRYTHDFRVEGEGVDEKAPKVGQGRERRVEDRPEAGHLSHSLPDQQPQQAGDDRDAGGEVHGASSALLVLAAISAPSLVWLVAQIPPLLRRLRPRGRSASGSGRGGDQRYERLAREAMKVVAIAYSFIRLRGGVCLRPHGAPITGSPCAFSTGWAPSSRPMLGPSR